MSIYHCSVKNISRGKGKSAVASAAYRSGEKLEDKETGLTHDFTKKGGVIFSEILLPAEAPDQYIDRSTLWNEVQKIEKASNARLAREIEIALPKELSHETQKILVREYVQENFVNKGMCADWALHDKGDGNPHAHIMLTTRSIKENGEWAPKSRKVYHLDENGNKVIKKRDKNGRIQYDCHKEDFNDWNKQEKVLEWRKSWADICNKYLDSEHRIDHRSLKDQGSELIPTIHEGYFARKIEKQGGISERCEYNRQVKETNKGILDIINRLMEAARIRLRLINKKSKMDESLGYYKQARNIRIALLNMEAFKTIDIKAIQNKFNVSADSYDELLEQYKGLLKNANINDHQMLDLIAKTNNEKLKQLVQQAIERYDTDPTYMVSKRPSLLERLHQKQKEVSERSNSLDKDTKMIMEDWKSIIANERLKSPNKTSKRHDRNIRSHDDYLR